MQTQFCERVSVCLYVGLRKFTFAHIALVFQSSNSSVIILICNIFYWTRSKVIISQVHDGV